MFVRFISSEVDPNSGVEQGIFCLAYDIWQADYFLDHEREAMEELRTWFGLHLSQPDRLWFRQNERDRAVCWFKSSAREHIRKVFEMIAIFEAHLFDVEMIWATEPGHIVYEDDFQVAAIPDHRRR